MPKILVSARKISFYRTLAAAREQLSSELHEFVEAGAFAEGYRALKNGLPMLEQERLYDRPTACFPEGRSPRPKWYERP